MLCDVLTLRLPLLTLPLFAQVRLFCDQQSHNVMAPTKHNALCGGRSAWEIIEQSVDFIQGRLVANSLFEKSCLVNIYIYIYMPLHRPSVSSFIDS